jgi:hypothetical protein
MRITEFMKRFIHFLALELVTLIASCDNEVKHVVCGCEDTDLQTHVDEGGIVAQTREGYKIISVDNGIVNPCEGDLPENLQTNGQLVTFSGSSLAKCTKNFPGYGIARTTVVELSSVKSATGLYESGDITIKLISVSGSKGVGFGYEIVHKLKNFFIRQSEVPGVEGTDPFENEADALKVAFLAAYKLDNFDDFPTIYLGELYLLGIIDTQ